MQKVFSFDGVDCYRFAPSLFQLFYGDLRRIDAHERVRFFLMLLHGYSVFYLYHGDEQIGYRVVATGGSFRFTFAGLTDIVLGPSFVSENHRGKRYSTKQLQGILLLPELTYQYAYSYIRKENVPSIRTAEGAGMNYISDGYFSKYTRQLVLCEKGSGPYRVYRYARTQEQG